MQVVLSLSFSPEVADFTLKAVTSTVYFSKYKLSQEACLTVSNKFYWGSYQNI